MKTSFLSVFFSVAVLMLIPVSVAQAALTIDVQAPETLEINEETVLTIEVTEDGEPVEVDDVSVTYDPEDGVFDEVLYDCSDEEVQDNCRANNRGVDGVFEAVFDLKKLPLTVIVEVDGEEKEVELTNDEPEEEAAPVVAPATTESSPPVVVSTTATTAEATTTTTQTTISPASVQAGPSPYSLIILVPLALMCGVVTYFVVKTGE